jgi:DNA-binding NtrC family response regulator
MDSPVILVLNSNRSELETLTAELEQEGYITTGVSSIEEMDSALHDQKNIRLALLDLTGFDKSVWQLCDQLDKVKIPFIVITPQRSPSIQRDSMKHGANGLLIKPIATKKLIEYIHEALGD